MKILLFFIASWLARLTLQIKKPTIIGITGTAGKTTIAGFLTESLSSVYGKEQISSSPHHYNGEYGLPLAILRMENPERNILKWCLLFCRAIIRLTLPYPRYLILEYGVDHPREMDYLLSIAVPDIAILAPISPNHIEQFGDFETYKAEKLKLECVRNIVAYSDWRADLSGESIFYGYGAMCDLDASAITQHDDHLEADIHIYREDYHISTPLFGAYQILNILPIFGVARYLHIPYEQIVETVEKLAPEAGRSRLLPGVNQSIIIDGSYNAGYTSMNEGIHAMEHLDRDRPIILLLGDMRELGTMSRELHEQIAHTISDFCRERTVEVLLVGPMMTEWVAPIVSQSHTCWTTLDSREAGKYAHNLVSQGVERKVIFVKGSQNTIFLEEAVAYLLADQSDTNQLCRQSEHWQEVKDDFFIDLDLDADERSQKKK